MFNYGNSFLKNKYLFIFSPICFLLKLKIIFVQMLVINPKLYHLYAPCLLKVGLLRG